MADFSWFNSATLKGFQEGTAHLRYCHSNITIEFNSGLWLSHSKTTLVSVEPFRDRLVFVLQILVLLHNPNAFSFISQTDAIHLPSGFLVRFLICFCGNIFWTFALFDTFSNCCIPHRIGVMLELNHMKHLFHCLPKQHTCPMSSCLWWDTMPKYETYIPYIII